MQIAKLSLTFCAAALSAVLVHASDDTPGQTAAIAAMHQKMQQADGTVTNTAAPESAPAAITPDTNDTPGQAAARAAVVKRMHEADGTPQPGQPITINAAGVVPPNAATMTPAETKMLEDAAAQANATKEAQTQAEAQAEAQKLAEEDAARTNAAAVKAAKKEAAAQAKAAKEAQKAAAKAKAQADKAAALAKAQADKTAADQAAAQKVADKAKADQDAQAAAAKAKAAAAVNYPGKELGFQAPPAAAPTISPEKQARLAELLEQYRANVISPEEYHKQRAAILAAP